VVEKDEIRRLLEAKIDASSEEELDEAFAFDGERCDRIVAKVLERIARERKRTCRASNAHLSTTQRKTT